MQHITISTCDANGKPLKCATCGQLATGFIDLAPACDAHNWITQAHQRRDTTRAKLYAQLLTTLTALEQPGQRWVRLEHGAAIDVVALRAAYDALMAQEGQ